MEEAEQCCTACTTTELRAVDDGLCAPCRRLRCYDSDRSTCATPGMSLAGDDEIPGSGGRMRRRTARSNETNGCAAASVVRWSYTTARSGVSNGCRNKRSWPLLVLLLMMVIAATTTIAEGARTATGNASSSSAIAYGTTINSAKDGVCQSIDIRNKISEYSKLNGCRVIEGFVQILLIDQGDANAYENIVFPDLVEITGYILMYRVPGLKSIGSLFPNLAVIRGHQLFINYALVAFEMQNLQEVGLHSLTDITRGSVRFEKNPNLCYADTIDWDLIAKASKGEHVISLKPLYTPDYYRELKLIRDFLGLNIEGALEKSNKPENECHVCDETCPPKPTDPDDKLCWNKQHCQKVCPKCNDDRACQASGECCDPNCLGGCTGPTASNCTVCRDFIVNNSRCVVTCPEDTYEFLQRRCITQQECRMMRRPREQPLEMHDYPYKPFGNQCILECPAGYEEKNHKGMLSCEECNGPCFRECLGITVDSRAAAQKLRGCTRIKGNLMIAIREGQIFVRDLEENLKDIEVITGYLKVFRSFPLVSLSFLSNLTEVQGQELDMKYYSIVILANQNLQELWNWTTRPPLKIGSKNGVPKVSFHFNPKLCPQKIEELRERTGLQPFTEVEVSTSSNGDKVACNVTELKSVVTSLSSKAAYIMWEPFKHHDLRTLLGYFIYWKEAPTQNVGMYDGRDACGGDGWMVDDIYVTESQKSASIVTNENLTQTSTDTRAAKVNSTGPYSTYTQKTILLSLKPYTQYAYYVKTYTISIERSGAQSKLQYFMTLPGQPSAVRALNVYSNASDSLVITWQPPLEPNSNLTHYMIIGVLEPYDVDYLKQRNYCDRPFRQRGHKPIEIPPIDEDKQQHPETQLTPTNQPKESQDSGISADAKSCPCQKREPEQTEKDVSSSIAFEDALHNQVYVKRGNSRRRRDVEEDPGPMIPVAPVVPVVPMSVMLDTVRMQRSVNTLLGEKDVMSDGKTPANELAVPRDPDAPQDSESEIPTKKSQPSKYNIEDERVNDAYTRFKRNVPATEKIFVMRGLQHFGKYNIIVMACRDKDANPLENECSTESMKSMQTLKLNNADNIPAESFKLEKLPGNDSSTMVKLHWAKPVNPNGVVIAYSIELKRRTSRPTIICVTPEEFLAEGNASILTDLKPGNYSVKVRALTFASTGENTPTLYFDVPESALAMPLWKVMLITVVIIVLLLCACMCAIYFFKKKFMRNVPSMRLIATVNPEYVSTVYIPDEWEVPRKKIQLLKELGNGSFGMVYEGIAKDVLKGKPEIRCAVKTVNENATDRERIEFLNEASVMKGFNTHHVVKLLGVVSQGQPTLVVMELMEKGDLKTYLRSHRPDVCENFSQQPPTLKRILQMAAEIADGMAYLSAKKFVHRDLAARNCMVRDDLTVKIGDFGMTRDIYETDYYRKGTKGLLPVRWMAPESLKDGVFTSFSDVWSYGVVLWEMVTLASQPYQGLSNDQVLRYVIDGGVMERPENCPDSMYVLMRQTWNHKATRRPTFLDIEAMLLTEIDVESFERVSFYHSPEGVEARNQNASQYFRNDKDLELVTLQDLREEEAEDEEDSPLRQDFGDFSSFDPVNSVENGSSGHFGMEPFADNSKPVGAIGFLDLNSSKAPLKAGFDDFDGVSAGSLASSKDTLNLPFAEDSVKSVRNSPYTQKKSSSRGNISQSSVGRSSLSPQSPSVLAASSNPGSSNVSLFKSNRPSPSLIAGNHSDPEYENHSPEAVELHTQSQPTTQQAPSSSRDVTGIRVSFPSMDAIDSDVEAGTVVPTKMVLSQLDANSRSDLSAVTSTTPLNKQYANKTNDSSQQQQQSSQQAQQQQSSQQQQQQPAPASLNNGYIGGAAT